VSITTVRNGEDNYTSSSSVSSRPFGGIFEHFSSLAGPFRQATGGSIRRGLRGVKSFSGEKKRKMKNGKWKVQNEKWMGG